MRIKTKTKFMKETNYLFGPEIHNISENNDAPRLIKHFGEFNRLIITRALIRADFHKFWIRNVIFLNLPQSRLDKFQLWNSQNLHGVFHRQPPLLLLRLLLLLRRRGLTVPGNVHLADRLQKLPSGREEPQGGGGRRRRPRLTVVVTAEYSVFAWVSAELVRRRRRLIIQGIGKRGGAWGGDAAVGDGGGCDPRFAEQALS